MLRSLSLKLLALIFLCLLTSCNSSSSKSSGGSTGSSSGGAAGGGGGGGDSTTPGWSFPTSTSSVQYAFMGLPYSYVALTGLTGGGWTLTSSTALPAGLALSQVGTTAVVQGTPTGSGQTLTGFTITATKAATPTQTAQFTLIVRGDLLRPFQWHLENDGVNFFSNTTNVTADEDMDVSSVWLDDVFGAGIRVAVSDTGLQTTHTDLSANMLTGMHRNYKTASSASGYAGTPSHYGEPHGTAVTGIIAAVGWNDIGVTGVAPMARVAGFQFLDSTQTSSIRLHQTTGDFEVFNYSYGTGLNADLEDDALYIAQLRDRVTNGRSGKGQLYVKSAGNEFSGFAYNDTVLGNITPPQNANIPAENNSPFIIVVGATGATPFVASYANAGSSLWVSAPGGEDGDSDPAIVSTDLSSCSEGFSTNTSGPYSFNDFERPASNATFLTYNPQCNYTSTMNGTSSAAPNVTGVIALLLSANPNLGWRDVKHILAVTADQVDAAAGNTDHVSAALRLGGGYVYEQGWVTNAAGYKYHNWYGFGRVNAAAAVAMAQGLYTNLPAWFETNEDFDDPGEGETGLAVAIPNFNAAGATRTLNITYPADTVVESVQLKIKATHSRSGTLGVELVSPSGTRSILLNINNALMAPLNGNSSNSPDADLDVVLITHAFYGEDASGTWTLKVVDGLNDALTGTLNEWSLNVLGRIEP